jgi:hypothetical protein
MYVHKSQFILKTTSTQLLSIQFLFWNDIYILVLSCLFLWIVSNLT